ncbi:thioredoxin family protein [Desulfolutivibrio sp.]|uniref:thioredoxin family protein n=1 Tax=Desulfolutivibrio sp. TaxID=2773296 RepID=UPI002F96E5ED
MHTTAVRFSTWLLLALLLTGTLFLASCDSAEPPKGSVFETERASSSQKTGAPGAPGATEATQKTDIQVPVPGMVTMVDLGAKSCIPCKMMTPILEALEKEYANRAAIVFIDVWKRPDQTPLFGIKAIPTQIFYDKNGKEIRRHEGFMDKQSISAILEKLLKE